MPQIVGLLETALYVDDMERSARFFEKILGLKPMLHSKRLTAFDAGQRGTLLVFKRGSSIQDIAENDYTIPGHDGSGPLHMAFAIPAGSYDEWLNHLTGLGIPIRGEVRWPQGGRSLYFEDPDGHVLELATPGLWPNYP